MNSFERMKTMTKADKQCKDKLDELDKPELSVDSREILRTLRDFNGCVVKVNGLWRYMENEFLSSAGGRFNQDQEVEKLIGRGLLGWSNGTESTGMSKYAYITASGRNAIE